MSFLLDTHVLLWWLFNDKRISKTAHGIIQDPDNKIFVSSASAWEIATKHRLSRLESAAVLLEDMPGCLRRAGFMELPIALSHATRAGSFPHAHRDPFDRMLAAQAIVDGHQLVTRDPALAQFGPRTVW